MIVVFFFVKQKTAYDLRISDWSSDVCSSDLSWIFEGVEDEVIGDFGLFGGGAAGFELDRVDHGLGSPDDTIVLASSEKYAEHVILVPEEQQIGRASCQERGCQYV